MPTQRGGRASVLQANGSNSGDGPPVELNRRTVTIGRGEHKAFGKHRPGPVNRGFVRDEAFEPRAEFGLALVQALLAIGPLLGGDLVLFGFWCGGLVRFTPHLTETLVISDAAGLSVAATTLACVTDELREMLMSFRKKAVEEGSSYYDVDPIPAEEVDRWIGHARPCAVLRQGGDGPVAGRFGGPLMLPAEVPDPEHPYVASVDLAALPKDSTDLPLPPDGHLLLFASLWDLFECENLGQAVYVPAGTPVAERDRNTWKYSDDEEYRGYVDSFPQGELSVRTEPDLPYHTLPGFPYGLSSVWSDFADRSEHLQIGGYANQEDSDPDPLETLARQAAHMAEEHGSWGGGEPVSGAVEDWVLLAHWNPQIDGREGMDIQWGIQRADLEARRFDRTFATGYWNP